MNMSTHAATIAAPKRKVAILRLAADLVVLTKPRIVASSTLAAAAGMAAQGGGWLKSGTGITLLGISLSVSSACAFNMWFERDTDALMSRTQARPLPAGRVEARVAFAFAVVTGLAGLCLVVAYGGAAASSLAAAALVLYAFAYTPLKRHTPAASFVGMVPGALPPLIGASALGVPSPLAWSLWAILTIWQVPHLMAVALRLRDQYETANLKTLMNWLGEERTVITMRIGLIVLIAVAFVPAISLPGNAALWVGGFASATIAFHGAVHSVVAGGTELRSRRFIVATVLYVLPLTVAILIGV